MLAVLACLIAFNIASHLRWHEQPDGHEQRAVLRPAGRRRQPDGAAVFQRRHHQSVRLPLPAAGHPRRGAAGSLVDLDHRRHHQRLLRRADAVFRPLALPLDHERGFSSLYIQGMLVCFALNAALLVIFITPHHRNLRAARCAAGRPAPARGRGRAHRAHGPAGLGRGARTRHAAGDALGDPGRLAAHAAFSRNPELLEEIDEMQAQVQRCKASSAASCCRRAKRAANRRCRPPSAPSSTSWSRNGARSRAGRDVRPTTTAFGHDLPMVSDSALKQMICNVLDNALEASPRLGRPRSDARRRTR